MPFNLLGATQGALEAGTQAGNDRLVDRLSSQRQKDLQWRQMQSNLFEDMVRQGHFPDITQDEIDQRLQEIWGDHKGNKKHLQEVSEQTHGVRGMLDKLGRVLGVSQQQQPVNAPMTRTPVGAVPRPLVPPPPIATGDRATQGTGGPQTTLGSDMISVQIPGMAPGQIHASRWNEFKQRYPNAMRHDMGIGQSVQ